MILISPSIALLLDREFNHSQKCLEVPIREKKLLTKYMAYTVLRLGSMGNACYSILNQIIVNELKGIFPYESK